VGAVSPPGFDDGGCGQGAPVYLNECMASFNETSARRPHFASGKLPSGLDLISCAPGAGAGERSRGLKAF
jgi:hypothetical protein